jgi:hypothetical protein
VNTVIDGCDGGDAINNPHNYKFGGIFTTADGWIFQMTPLATQIDADSCDVSYRLVLDKFDVRGKNFPDAELGIDGAGLKHQLDGCGAVTDWEFVLTPDDSVYQWYAHGNLPMGTKACIGRALKSAGGSSDGNCHGAG